MPSFFPPPFPFFRPNINYRQMNNPHNFQNKSNFNTYNNNSFSHNPNHLHNNNTNHHKPINTENIKDNCNNENIENEIKFNAKKNSITNMSNDSNTISSLLPFNISNLLPTNIGPLGININGFTNMSEPIFELFGIHLFLDDIIIICILIFLFQENVKDEMLYIILIMLLFS